MVNTKIGACQRFSKEQDIEVCHVIFRKSFRLVGQGGEGFFFSRLKNHCSRSEELSLHGSLHQLSVLFFFMTLSHNLSDIFLPSETVHLSSSSELIPGFNIVRNEWTGTLTDFLSRPIKPLRAANICSDSQYQIRC